METKKGRPSAASKAADGRKVVRFMGEVKLELKRVDWTSKEELKAYTKIVVACIFAFGFSIYFIDLLIRGCLGLVNMMVKLLIG